MATDPFSHMGALVSPPRAPGASAAFSPARPLPGVERVSYEEAQGMARPRPSASGVRVQPQTAVGPDYAAMAVTVALIAAAGGAVYYGYKYVKRKRIFKSISMPRREW